MKLSAIFGFGLASVCIGTFAAHTFRFAPVPFSPVIALRAAEPLACHSIRSRVAKLASSTLEEVHIALPGSPPEATPFPRASLWCGPSTLCRKRQMATVEAVAVVDPARSVPRWI